MKKKIYIIPTTQVVKLQQQYMILAGSQGMNEEIQDVEVIVGW